MCFIEAYIVKNRKLEKNLYNFWNKTTGNKITMYVSFKPQKWNKQPNMWYDGYGNLL